MKSYIELLAYPQALWLLLALPLLASLALWDWVVRRRGWRLLGKLSSPHGRRALRGLLIGGGLLLAGLAAAGPHWGREPVATVSAVRDLVVVLDVSRSMLAETPSRQLRAQRLLTDLANTLKQRGGHRVALVVFAAKARLVVPLTTDYSLFQDAVLRQDAARLPAELRPGKDGPPSGTRLGEGLQQGVAAHDPDPQYRGSQVILLVSDGDDPADDGEWKDGAAAARKVGIPVFVAGVGDPTKPSKIRIGDMPLIYGGEPVETKLNEEILKEIAKRTDGSYFPVRTENVAAGTLFPAILEAAAARPRESPPIDDYHPRFRWFFAPALVMLMASLLVSDRRRVEDQDQEEGMALKPLFAPRASKPNSLIAAAAVALIAVILAGAAPQMENPLRQGNEAFQRKEYAAALQFFEQAEESAADPGLVAFNKGAALLRLNRYREAEWCYVRCLQDRAIPPERRVKALYDLGNALLQRGAESRDMEALRRAAEYFESCFDESSSDKALRDDAEHNLELARLLWVKIRAETKTPQGMKNPDDPKNNGRIEPKQDSAKDNGSASQGSPDGQGERAKPGSKDGADTDHQMPGAGSIETLPDTSELQPLDANDARDLLDRVIRRIERDQGQARGPADADHRNIKDW